MLVSDRASDRLLMRASYLAHSTKIAMVELAAPRATKTASDDRRSRLRLVGRSSERDLMGRLPADGSGIMPVEVSR